MVDDTKAAAAAIRLYRVQHRLTQAELGERLGYAQQTIAHAERPTSDRWGRQALHIVTALRDRG